MDAVGWGHVPRHVLALTHKLQGWDNSLELLMVQAKDTVSAVRNEIKTPGYYLPTGGAYTGQGTTMSNPALPNYPQWGTAVPGMGRSVYVGLNFKF